MRGDSLGIRRLQTPHKNLLPLKKSLLNLTGIIKQNTSTFIDSNGFPFIYEKTKWCKLKYYKIRNIEFALDLSYFCIFIGLVYNNKYMLIGIYLNN